MSDLRTRSGEPLLVRGSEKAAPVPATDLTMTDMAHANVEMPRPDSDLEVVKESNTPGNEVGTVAGAKGVYLKRPRRRRLDLSNAHGVLRESARVYRELAEGKLSPAAADVRSRIRKRHGELLTAQEQAEQFEIIKRQLEALQSERGHPALPAPASGPAEVPEWAR